jgi:hypothetical protein
MKKILLSAAALISLSNVMAQGPVVTDTVITGVGYATNVWYSLQNDEVGTAVSSNWDIALAASASPKLDQCMWFLMLRQQTHLTHCLQ